MRKTPPAMLLIISILGIASIGTGTFLTALHRAGSTAQNSSEIYLLGPARSLLSNTLYTRADVYFHKGAARSRKEAFVSIFQKWGHIIHPSGHAHAEGDQISEIMPWLKLATQSDPHNIEVYLVASFWLNGECGRPDLARRAIQEAITRNPERYELYLEKGRLFLSAAEYDRAKKALLTSKKLLQNRVQTDPEQSSIDLTFILAASSYIFELQGNHDKALSTARENLKNNPDRNTYKQRVQLLESRQSTPVQAKEHLQILCKDKAIICHDEHDEHDKNHNCNPQCKSHHNSIQH